MERNQIISDFSHLGTVLLALSQENPTYNAAFACTKENFESVAEIMRTVNRYNNWFTYESVQKSFAGIASWLDVATISDWAEQYTFSNEPKQVAIVMAGNLPLVGFHDVFCVLLSGNRAKCKLSSDDRHLLPAIKMILNDIQPLLAERIQIVEGKLGEVDAVIATGSNNSQNYFQQYFSKYPHVFRGNRTSIAVLTGKESNEELHLLGKDIFTYFGLGCRNVTHLMVPKGYDFVPFFEAIYPYGDVINHYKYANNYDYNRAVHLLNLINLLDNNFLLVRESELLHAPLAMVFYHTYENEQEISAYLEENEQNIQVVVGQNYTPFGIAQEPKIGDFADNFDTMKWLQEL